MTPRHSHRVWVNTSGDGPPVLPVWPSMAGVPSGQGCACSLALLGCSSNLRELGAQTPAFAFGWKHRDSMLAAEELLPWLGPGLAAWTAAPGRHRTTAFREGPASI